MKEVVRRKKAKEFIFEYLSLCIEYKMYLFTFESPEVKLFNEMSELYAHKLNMEYEDLEGKLVRFWEEGDE